MDNSDNRMHGIGKWVIIKKMALLSLLFISGCSSKISLNTDPAIVKAHPGPIMIYEIGDWNAQYVVLNLVDANHEHFNIRIRRNNNLVVGAEFRFSLKYLEGK